MRSIIRLMPDSLANQIAAGEVVQRPASVVKELLENAKDAGATTIDLIIKDAGKSLIQVVDDGVGMSEIDAKLAFERHATSKIKEVQDLFAIRTFGFRGEALASIAAVAQVKLKTRTVEDSLGISYKIEGGNPIGQEYVTAPKGTSIAVSNLFFNVPARRNFLKSNAVETRHILNEFFNIAIAYPETNFHFTHNDNSIFDLTATDLKGRILQLYSTIHAKQLLTVIEETPEAIIYGLIGTPDAQRKTRGEQYLFVNRRFVKSGFINHAIQTSYGSLLNREAFPFFALFLEIEPSKIDINIHPTKTEIKFEDEKIIYALVHSAVRKSLGITLNTTNTELFTEIEKKIYASRPVGEGQTVRQFKREGSESFNKPNRFPFPMDTFFATTPTLSPNQIIEKKQPEGLELKDLQSPLFTKKAWQIEGSYIIASENDGIVLIDPYLAHWRILYEELLNRHSTRNVPSQQLLFPYTLSLNSNDYIILRESLTTLNHLGYDVRAVGNQDFLVCGTPIDLKYGDLKTIMEEICNEVRHSLPTIDDWAEIYARKLAAKNAVPMGKKLNEEEINYIYTQIFNCHNSQWSPDGKRIFIHISRNELEQRFC